MTSEQKMKASFIKMKTLKELMGKIDEMVSSMDLVEFTLYISTVEIPHMKVLQTMKAQVEKGKENEEDKKGSQENESTNN